MEIIPWTPLQPPLLPTRVAPLQKSRSNWILGRVFYTFQTKTDSILTQIQRWIWEKQLIEPKVQRLCHKHFLHKFLSCLIPTHTLSMSTSPHIRTKKKFLTHILLFFFFPLCIPPNPLPLQASMTFLELVPLVQWKFRNPFAPINGLLILQGPMRIWEWITIQLKLGWESLGPMNHKRYSILQSKRMTIFMINGSGGSILPPILDILMRSLDLDL